MLCLVHYWGATASSENASVLQDYLLMILSLIQLSLCHLNLSGSCYSVYHQLIDPLLRRIGWRWRQAVADVGPILRRLVTTTNLSLSVQTCMTGTEA